MFQINLTCARSGAEPYQSRPGPDIITPTRSCRFGVRSTQWRQIIIAPRAGLGEGRYRAMGTFYEMCIFLSSFV